MPDDSIRDEVAKLTEAVNALRDREVADELASLRAEVEKLRAERAAHHCTGGSCMHIHYGSYPLPGCAPVYPQVWYGTVTTGTSGYTTTNNPGSTTLGISN